MTWFQAYTARGEFNRLEGSTTEAKVEIDRVKTLAKIAMLCCIAVFWLVVGFVGLRHQNQTTNSGGLDIDGGLRVAIDKDVEYTKEDGPEGFSRANCFSGSQAGRFRFIVTNTSSNGVFVNISSFAREIPFVGEVRLPPRGQIEFYVQINHPPWYVWIVAKK